MATATHQPALCPSQVTGCHDHENLLLRKGKPKVPNRPIRRNLGPSVRNDAQPRRAAIRSARKVYPLMRTRRIPIVATCVLALAAVTSCAQSDPGTSPTSPSALSPSEPSGAQTSDTEAAAAAATATVDSYYATLDRLRQDHSKPIDALSKVETSTLLRADRHLIEGERSKKLRQVGDTEVVDMSVESVNLDNSDPDVGKVPTVTVDVCWDVSEVDLIDASGKSVVSPDRADVGWIRYIVANYQYRTDPVTGWRVASAQDLEQQPCKA